MPRKILIQGDECGCSPWFNANFPDFHSRIKANTLSSTKYVRRKGRRPLGITNIQLVCDKQKNGPQNFAGRLKGGGVKTY